MRAHLAAILALPAALVLSDHRASPGSPARSRFRDTAPAADTTPAAVIQRGLEAYNRRDLDGLMAIYDPQVRSPDFPDDSTGGESFSQLRADYTEGYRDPDCRPLVLVGRMVHGAIVVDRYERTLGSGRVQTIMTIFEVRRGRIQRRWHVNR